jgi:hypothetical protein
MGKVMGPVFRGLPATPKTGQQSGEIMTDQQGVAVGAFVLALLVMTCYKAVAVGAILVAFLVGFGNDAAPIESPTNEVSPSSTTMVAPKPVPLSPNYRYPDGLELTITQITHAKLDGFRATDDPNAKPGDPYTIVTVTLRNGTHHEVEAAFVGQLRYGPRKLTAHRVNLNDSVFVVASLSPGERSSPYDMGFLVPADGQRDVILQVTVDLGRHQPATFAGSLNQP